MKYLLVCNSSYSTYYSFSYGTTSADFNAFGNVHVSSIHLLMINDCISLHRKSAHSLINLPRIFFFFFYKEDFIENQQKRRLTNTIYRTIYKIYIQSTTNFKIQTLNIIKKLLWSVNNKK